MNGPNAIPRQMRDAFRESGVPDVMVETNPNYTYNVYWPTTGESPANLEAAADRTISTLCLVGSWKLLGSWHDAVSCCDVVRIKLLSND